MTSAASNEDAHGPRSRTVYLVLADTGLTEERRYISPHRVCRTAEDAEATARNAEAFFIEQYKKQRDKSTVVPPGRYFVKPAELFGEPTVDADGLSEVRLVFQETERPGGDREYLPVAFGTEKLALEYVSAHPRALVHGWVPPSYGRDVKPGVRALATNTDPISLLDREDRAQTVWEVVANAYDEEPGRARQHTSWDYGGIFEQGDSLRESREGPQPVLVIATSADREKAGRLLADHLAERRKLGLKPTELSPDAAVKTYPKAVNIYGSKSKNTSSVALGTGWPEREVATIDLATRGTGAADKATEIAQKAKDKKQELGGQRSSKKGVAR